jgi:hypothetical protein
MSDTRKNIIIEVDVASGKAKVEGLTRGFVTLDNAVSKVKTELSNLNSEMFKGRKQSGAYGSAVIELGRVIQDANYGIRGMANNITQLATQLALAIEPSKGFMGFIRGIKSALMGPGGFILIISAVVSLMEAYAIETDKATKATREFSLELALLAREMAKIKPPRQEELDRIRQMAQFPDEDPGTDQKRKRMSKLRQDYENSKKRVIQILKEEVKLKHDLSILEDAEVPNVEEIIRVREELITIQENDLKLKKEATTDFPKRARLEAEIYEKELERSRVRNEMEEKYAFFLKERPKDLQKIEAAHAGVVLYGIEPQAAAMEQSLSAEITFTEQSMMLAQARAKAWQDAAEAAINISRSFSEIIDAQAEIDLNNAIARGEDEEAARLRIEKRKQGALIKQAKFEAAIQLAMLGAQISRDVAGGLLAAEVGFAHTAKIGLPQAAPFLIAYAAQAAAIIAGIIAAKKKAEAAISGLKVSNIGTGSSPVGGGAQPNFNIVGSTGINQLSETIQGQLQSPIKTYVVSKDVATAIELERNIVSGTSIS